MSGPCDLSNVVAPKFVKTFAIALFVLELHGLMLNVVKVAHIFEVEFLLDRIATHHFRLDDRQCRQNIDLKKILEDVQIAKSNLFLSCVSERDVLQITATSQKNVG